MVAAVTLTIDTDTILYYLVFASRIGSVILLR